MYTYETERLGFRLWNEKDADACFALASDEHVGPPCGWQPHKTPEESKSILKNVLMNEHTYCIIEKETGVIIGNIGIDEPHEGEGIEAGENERELGYWLGFPYWNKGYMTEAVKGTVNFCFDTLKIPRLWCGNFTDNPASGKVQEKNGFRYEKTISLYWDRLGKNVEMVIRSLENPNNK